MTSDPFESLYQPACLTHLYISGRLTLLRVPSWLSPGLWIRFPDHVTHSAWHRRLDAHGFLWLRAAVRAAIESGKLSAEFSDAESQLEQIAAIGIREGVFAADEIASHYTAPEWYSFSSGLPTWADDADLDPLPPAVATNHKTPR